MASERASRPRPRRCVNEVGAELRTVDVPFTVGERARDRLGA